MMTRDVFYNIYEAKEDLVVLYNIEPIAILVGPKEWLDIKERAVKGTGSVPRVGAEALDVMELYGLPLRVKSTPGVEFELPKDKAYIFLSEQKKGTDYDS